MDEVLILLLVKENLGIRNTVRDPYLSAIIQGTLKELEDEKGIVLDSSNQCHIMFVVDYSAWRFNNKEAQGSMPRNLQYRLHNLLIHNGSVVV